MNYSVKRLADMAGVTPRTMHYYDQIGLLRPSAVGGNGYRYYDEPAMLRLQQILFYRELGLSLHEIKAVLDDPSFDVQTALVAHRVALREQVERLETLVRTIDATLAHLRGEREMDAEELFGGFETVEEKELTHRAMDQHGTDNPFMQESARRWRSYSAADRARIKEEGSANYVALVALIGQDPADAAVQVQIGRWHNHLRYYYEPTPELLAGLGEAYASNPEFAATFEAMHPNLPAFLRDAIAVYVAQLPS